MRLIDSHCHIHESEFFAVEEREAAYQRAIETDIAMILVGTSEVGSVEALEFASNHTDAYAVIGVHPHETSKGYQKIAELLAAGAKPVGIGEIGLDYFYMHTDRATQIAGLEQQLQWAQDYDLPVSFHVRDYHDTTEGSVFDDFWPIFDNFSGVRGVLHSFTDNRINLDRALQRDLYIGVNGIATFAPAREAVYRAVPLSKILLETDSPFLTPTPLRGTINEPKNVGLVAEFIARRRNIAISDVAEVTTDNTKRLFRI